MKFKMIKMKILHDIVMLRLNTFYEICWTTTIVSSTGVVVEDFVATTRSQNPNASRLSNNLPKEDCRQNNVVKHEIK